MATQQRTGNVLGTAIQVVLLLLLLSILAGVLVVVLAAMQAIQAPGQAVTGVTDQASRAISTAQQALRDATDPNRPPTGLTYDTEFSALDTWKVGQALPGGAQYVLTVQSVKRRDNAESSDVAQYAIIHAELRQPRELRVLGQLLRSDNDPHDYVLYKGETFRIGNALYRVNWVSNESSTVAAGVYRQPDAVRAPIKFAYD